MSKLMENVNYQRVMDGFENPEKLYESNFHEARPGKNWKPYRPQTRYSEKYIPHDCSASDFWDAAWGAINDARKAIDMTFIDYYVLKNWHRAGTWLIDDVSSEELYIRVLYKMCKTIELARAYAKIACCTLTDVLRDAVNKRLRIRDPELQAEIINMLSLWQAQWADEDEWRYM